MNQHPDLYHSTNHKCGNCRLFKTACPNPEYLGVPVGSPDRIRHANSLSCFLIFKNYKEKNGDKTITAKPDDFRPDFC